MDHARAPRPAPCSVAPLLRALPILLGLSVPTLAAETVQSPTAGALCSPTAAGRSEELGCRGPAGYVAVIFNRDRVMRINYGIADRADLEREPPGSGLLWRGTGQLLGDRIEWRLARGRPFAAIVRIFTLGPDERALQQFLVAKVTPAGSCELSRIDVKEPNAFATARDIADSRSDIVDCGLKGAR
jgi:hypothetical protein